MPLAQDIEWQFQRNLQQHVFANELRFKVQRMKECFPGPSLPSPTTEVIAAWNDLPNDMVDILPMSMKTGLVFLQAPPPTPIGFASDTDDATSDECSLNGSSDDGWLLVDDTESPMPDVVASRNLERSTTGDGDSMSRCSNSDQPLDRQINEIDSFRSTDSNSPSSGHESLSSSSRASPRPMGFNNTVNQWLLDYRGRGVESFVESLIAFGAVSPGTAALASRVAHAVMRKVAKISCTEGKSLEIAIRTTALTTFKKYWKSNDTWTEVSSTAANTMSPIAYGINIACFMGGLFDAGVCNAKDVYLCLSLLSEGEKCFDRLCAMHGLLVQANDKLCKSRNFPALTQFKHEIMSRDGETGEYLWVTSPRSKMVIADIITTIERWQVSQALRRDQPQMSPGDRIIRRRRAVGPRLRNAARPMDFIVCV